MSGESRIMSRPNPFDPTVTEYTTSIKAKDLQGSTTTRSKPMLSSSTSRRPLGQTQDNNVPHAKHGVTNDGDGLRIKKAMEEVAEQRRKRAEAEGIAQGARKDAVIAQETVAHLRKQLEKAQARIAKRDETIAALANPGADKKLETKFEELLNRYQASKDKHQAQLESLEITNHTLQSSLTSLQAKYDQSSTHVHGLQKANRSAEDENAQLKSQIETLMNTASGSSKQSQQMEKEKISWANERLALGREISETRAEVERIAREGQAELDVAQNDNQHLRDLLAASTAAFQDLSSTSVRREILESTESRCLELKSQILESEYREQRLRWALQAEREQKRELAERTSWLQKELRDSEERISELSGENKEVRRDLAEVSRRLFEVSSDSAVPLDHTSHIAEGSVALLDLTLNHLQMVTADFQDQMSFVNAKHTSTLAALTSTSTSLASTEQSLSVLKVSHEQLKTLHSELVKAHEPCSATEAVLRADVIRANQAEAAAKTEVREVEDEIKRAEERVRLDRESLKRANEASLRWKAAETALEEEVDTLRAALTEAYAFETSYNELQEQHDLLISKYNLAIAEFDHLSQQNAALIGHTNGDQKLNYVESVRREMALVKQELASTRMMLNNANDKIESLMDEVEAYKNIEAPLIAGLGGSRLGMSTRTRVVRRQQEGSRLTLSSCKSTGNLRSVSGPVGR